jgi:hypothetical protein
MKSSQSIWRYVVNVKSTVKISSIFLAFLENMNFNFHTLFSSFNFPIRDKVHILWEFNKIWKKNFHFFWHYYVKQSERIFQIFVPFSEYMKFDISL